MDLIKKLTGKKPDEYELVAQSLVDNADVELFAKLVKQDDFLFDFIKNNVALRIKKACNNNNYLNLLKFFDYYSSSYDYMIAETLYQYGGIEVLPAIKEMYISGTLDQKTYAMKYFSLVPKDYIVDQIELIRTTALSDFEPLSLNSIDVLSKLNDEVFKSNAIEMLKSKDEFEQYNGVKYLVSYKAQDMLPLIIEVMKKSSLSENIASEIPYLISLEDLTKSEDGLLVICNIVNAIPEIIPLSSVLDYNLYSAFDTILKNGITSSSAVLLRMAQEKFSELAGNDEYLFDCDKNTKDEIARINQFLSKINSDKLKSLLYDELFEESAFVFFALDFVDEVEELETLLNSSNPTLLVKILYKLKEQGFLYQRYKDKVLSTVTDEQIIRCVEAL